MKKENRFFGEILSSLNGKVNRRLSYIHNTSLKYHRGNFSHDRVINNLKNETYLQSPRYYQPYDIKTKRVVNANTSRKNFDETPNVSLRASLVKFHLRTVKTRESKNTLIPEKINLKKKEKITHDANYNTDFFNM